MLSVLICKDKLLKCFPCSRHPSFIHLYFGMWQTAKTFRRLWKLYKWCYRSSQNGGVSGPAAWKHGQSFLIKPVWSTLLTGLSSRLIKRTHCVRISGETVLLCPRGDTFMAYLLCIRGRTASPEVAFMLCHLTLSTVFLLRHLFPFIMHPSVFKCPIFCLISYCNLFYFYKKCNNKNSCYLIMSSPITA